MNFINTVVRSWRMFVIRLFPETYNRSSQFPELCMVEDYHSRNQIPSSNQKNFPSLLDEIIGNGFLWAVPKKRRSLERRMTRRMGFGKMILPKRNLVVCDACGHFHPVHTICGNCYEKVKSETKLIQDAVMKELKLDPIDKEVVIMYENDSKDSNILNGKRIVEVPKTRPSWFSKNLLAKDSEFPRKKNEAVSETAFAVEVEPTKKSS
ncbi:39S ribosomal protein L32, mitochondrial-like [Argiope bruennichi]|uniref:39S ribosomal protein L32, mitochondrial-like n=1 Tax=Argiope bruennichi TaxID=94029 RepID=UPI002494B0F5|nr:39S ribosomal protein L32, mitochondrial-like [Argiope bruennichi]